MHNTQSVSNSTQLAHILLIKPDLPILIGIGPSYVIGMLLGRKLLNGLTDRSADADITKSIMQQIQEQVSSF